MPQIGLNFNPALQNRIFGAQEPFSIGNSGQEEDSAQKTSRNFAKALADAIQEVNQSDARAKQLQADMVQGKPVEIHEVTIASAKADLLTGLTTAMTQKAVGFLKEVQSMQV